ncbi:MAG TPA: hypothetical protein VGB63_02980 [Pedobacter sp.]|jgi:hypothetical protein
MSYEYYQDDGQHMVRVQTFGLLIAAKYLIKLFIYSPLIFTAIAITNSIGDKDEFKSFKGLFVIFLITCILYLLVYFLKGLLIGLKTKGNFFWIPLFLFCIAFTCVLPVYLAFEPVGKLVMYMSKTQKPDELLQWVISLTIGYLVYFQYKFMTNIAPKWAFPFYVAGFDIAFGNGASESHAKSNAII